jgi:hypothetical protein
MGHFWPAGMLRRDPLMKGLYETSLESYTKIEKS